MKKFAWKDLLIYLNFLVAGNSVEEVKLAAQAYAQTVHKDIPQSITLEPGDERVKTEESFIEL